MGRPKADPVGTRSALPATKAAGMLIGWWKPPKLNCGDRALRILVRNESARHPIGAETVQHLQALKGLVSVRI